MKSSRKRRRRTLLLPCMCTEEQSTTGQERQFKRAGHLHQVQVRVGKTMPHQGVPGTFNEIVHNVLVKARGHDTYTGIAEHHLTFNDFH